MTLPDPDDSTQQRGTSAAVTPATWRCHPAPDGAEELELQQLRQFAGVVAGRVHAQIEAVDGVSVVVLLGDTLVFAGSNQFTEAVDTVQRELMEGPCLMAMASGDVVSTRWIGVGERRWPGFTARTAPLALRGVESTPLLANGAVTGSVNLYAQAAERLDAVDPGVFAEAFRTSERALSSARLLAVAALNTRWLKHAGDDAADVARAVGWLMDRYRMSTTEGRTLIAQLARQDGVDEPTAARSLTRPTVRSERAATDPRGD